MPTTDDDPFGALLARLNDDEHEAEREAEHTEHAREADVRALVKALFSTDQDTDTEEKK